MAISERQRERARLYYQQNKDKWRRRYERNYEQLLQYQRERYAQNPEAYIAYQKEYRQMNTRPTVYVMTNTITGRRYVGSALLYRGRISEHKWALKNNLHHSELMQEDYDEHGWESFTFTVLETGVEEEFLRASELRWYLKLKPEYNTYIPRVEDQVDEPLPIRKRRPEDA